MRVIIWRDESLENFDDNEHNDSDSDDEENDDMERLRQHIAASTIKIPTIISTPFGQVSSNDVGNIMYEKQMFTGHVNFYITSDIALKILEVKGVDGFHVLSPYSFAVCVGMCFFFGDVLADIETAIDVEAIDLDEDSSPEVVSIEKSNQLLEENKELIKEATDSVADQKFWFVYIIPNGKMISETFESEEDMLKNIDFYKECTRLSNGILLSSLDS